MTIGLPARQNNKWTLAYQFSSMRAGARLNQSRDNMQIHAIKEDEHSPFDIEAFSAELRELSDRYGVRLVSLGAVATVDDGRKGSMYLAVWSTEAEENQRD
jgi:hypothetical protein